MSDVLPVRWGVLPTAAIGATVIDASARQHHPVVPSVPVVST
jgi:hypothetical protein